jgi:ArsR family transcriptional regulator
MSNNEKNIDLHQLADMFKALANPNRLKIFMQLIGCCQPGTRCDLQSDCCAFVGDLSKDLSIVPSTVSHHIKELRRAGLIKMRRQGQKIECWVDPEAVRNLIGFFSG